MSRSPFDILKCVHYVDKSVLFLNKPPGLVCQAQLARNKLYQARPALEDGSRRKGRGNDFDLALREIQTGLKLENVPYPVHRLDKGTTGSLILARTTSMAQELSRQFTSRSIDKTYLAIVRGGPSSFPEREGTVEARICYTDGRGWIDASSKSPNSKSSWKVLSSSPVAPLTLVQLTLHTGLKHQLRLHMAYSLRAPILGDPLYATAKVTKAISDVTTIPAQRTFLHASLIEMDRYLKTGPKKRIRLGLRAPLPADFLKICSDASLPINSAFIKGGVTVDGTPIDETTFPPLEGKWQP